MSNLQLNFKPGYVRGQSLNLGFRVRSEEHPQSVYQARQESADKAVASRINELLSSYENVLSSMDSFDGTSSDLNSAPGEVATLGFEVGGKSYDGYAKFKPYQDHEGQPVSKAELQVEGQTVFRCQIERALGSVYSFNASLADPVSGVVYQLSATKGGPVAVKY